MSSAFGEGGNGGAAEQRHPPASVEEIPDDEDQPEPVISPSATAPPPASADEIINTDKASWNGDSDSDTHTRAGAADETEATGGSSDTEAAEAGDEADGGEGPASEPEQDGDQDEEEEEEEILTAEEREQRLAEATAAKLRGNDFFRQSNWEQAIAAYTEAIDVCPRKDVAGAPFYANRAACYLKLEKYASCIEDATKALKLEPVYPKASLRRAIANEKLDKLEEALADYNTVLESEPYNDVAKSGAARLPPLVEAQREKLKDEMLGNLKKLGNMFLKPFGLSTENFKMQQNAEGGYSVNFEQ